MQTYLCIINLARTEKRIEGIVSGKEKTGKVDEKSAGNVEEDEEEVQAQESEDNVDLRNGGLLLEVVEGWILRELEQPGQSTPAP